LLNQQQKLLM